jgi:hypothetical protein
MKVLYIAIGLGLAALYYVHSQQGDEKEQVKKGNISEGNYAQEAPPSMEDLNYIKKFLPDYDTSAAV